MSIEKIKWPDPNALTAVGWQIPDVLSRNDWIEWGKLFARVEVGVQWWLGDWWNGGHDEDNKFRYGEHNQLFAEGGPFEDSNYQTFSDCSTVARAFEFARRRANLSFTHHREVLGLSSKEQDEWLDKTEKEGWSTRELRQMLKLAKRDERERTLIAELPQGKYRAILADPPWSFEVYSGAGKDRAAETHYPTMSLDEIKALRIDELAADDCCLFLWAVLPELPGALEVIEAWGFEYKTVAFAWVKQNKSSDGLFWGMGYWTRANVELVLLATKGSPQRLNADVHQVILSPVGSHSTKPDETYARIERLVGGPYLELFARQERPGWKAWGNEIIETDEVEREICDVAG